MLAKNCTAFSEHFPAEHSYFFTVERNLIGADFDHMLGNHFWTANVHRTINKTKL